jgi:hypothetical protein
MVSGLPEPLRHCAIRAFSSWQRVYRIPEPLRGMVQELDQHCAGYKCNVNFAIVENWRMVITLISHDAGWIDLGGKPAIIRFPLSMKCSDLWADDREMIILAG